MKLTMMGESAQTQATRKIYEPRHDDDDDFEDEDEDDELGSSVATSTKSQTHTGYSEDSSSQGIAQKEDRLVRYSKTLLLLVIFALAVGMGCITYAFVKGEQNAAYKNHFREVSTEIVSISQGRAREIYNNLEAFSATITSIALVEKATWPFVVVPDYQAHALISNQITGASRVIIVPFVKHQDRAKWESFSVNKSLGWLAEGHHHDEVIHPALYVDKRFDDNEPTGTADHLTWDAPGMVVPYIWDSINGSRVPSEPADVYYPAWQTAPAPDYTPYMNIDVKKFDFFDRVIQGMLETDQPVITEVTDAGYLGRVYENRFDRNMLDEPHSYLFQPIYDTLRYDRSAVAVMMAFFNWRGFFENSLPDHERNIIVVMYGTCNQTFSYELQGSIPIFLGEEDFHDPKFDDLGVDFDIAPFAKLPETNERKYCQYNGRIFPTASFQDEHFTQDPYYYAASVIACFIITTLVFVIYDYLVKKRQERILDQALKTTKIVNSIFPANVRDRLLDGTDPDHQSNNSYNKKKGGVWTDATKNVFLTAGNKAGSSNLQGSSNHHEAIFGSKPIADLFPSTTIMFADMTGFTAWSSTREPTQVFMLLETVYHSFDMIAKRRKVFKVETIGDCYVAVAGLPNPRKDHAVVMARFASECRESMQVQVQHLETTLGPDTSTLGLRIGLHSGAVTAGVLRGEKGRFQLFGDTMNTASRMESTSERGKIQVSRETANLLTSAGKGFWLIERQSKIQVKGKGELATYFLQIPEGSGSGSGYNSLHSGESIDSITDQPMNASGEKRGNPLMPSSILDDRTQRLVRWNCELLATHLKEINARRSSKPKLQRAASTLCTTAPTATTTTTTSPIEQVQDVLNLTRPHSSNPRVSQKIVDARTVVLPPKVMAQLTDFVSRVAATYPPNPFHNFDHASHVCMSVAKLMSRIVQPNATVTEQDHNNNNTFAVTFSDPLIQFSCVLAALFHDAQHPGVGNPVLVQENDPLAIKYDNKSVAEQNSVDVCWNLLMQPEYKELQGAIFAHDPDELQRFRSLIVQCVLATDIQDAALGALRRARWEKAFATTTTTTSAEGGDSANTDSNATTDDDDQLALNRKGTIVLEHLMQASDVAHTMQHWHVFRKWNECLFREVYFSYLEGRINKDPSEGWYQGEIGFFDFYIIPLAKKLETCGVFGVSSTEYLGYACENRMEWQDKGKAIVQEYVGSATTIWEQRQRQQQQQQQQQQQEQEKPVHEEESPEEEFQDEVLTKVDNLRV